MRTTQCSKCLHYRGYLQCDAFPQGIPEYVLTGAVTHDEPIGNDNGILFQPMPDAVLNKSEDPDDVEAVVEHINQVVDKEGVGYEKVKTVLKRKGYAEGDFEPGGVLYGYSTNELIKLASGQ